MTYQPRRQVIRSAIAAALAAFGVPGRGAPTGRTDRPTALDASAAVDVHIELHAVEDQVAIRPGTRTKVWRYHGKLLRGDAGSLEASPGTYPGPIIRMRQGQRVRIDLINSLPESTVTHWHGLHVPEAMDGHPRFAIAPGERYIYDFTVINRAGSYWFHAHPDGRTGKQIYFGLSGLFLVSDEEEAALDLPSGPYDLPLVIQDRTFDDDNQLVYLSERAGDATSEGSEGRGMMGGGMMGGGGMGGGMMGDGRGAGRTGGMGQMMAGMMGMLGDQILVNGQPDASLAVEAGPYRLRLLNASNTRIYKLAWNEHSPLTVIGTDDGLLAEPLQRDYIMLAPAERVDLWVDFGRWPAGTELTLQSLSFEGGMAMSGMMMGGTALPDGAQFPVLQMRVKDASKNSAVLPQRLSRLPLPQPRAAVNFDRPKVFDITMGMMRWGINGKSFEMEAVTSLETVKLGTQEVWEFRNDATMMTMAHSMHVHGLQFQVIGRSVGGGFARARDSVKDGYLDEGWKDTVLVMPGERVHILVRFADYPGLFLYHCHMLEHEDSGLMRNYLVKA